MWLTVIYISQKLSELIVYIFGEIHWIHRNIYYEFVFSQIIILIIKMFNKFILENYEHHATSIFK